MSSAHPRIAIKICGIGTVAHALAAAYAGADYIGLVFAPSRRQIAPHQATTITAALRQRQTDRPAAVSVVGLFVNERPDQINAIVREVGLDYVQLSGNETPDQAAGICCPVMKSVRLNEAPEEDAWLSLSATPSPSSSVVLAPCPLIVDAHVPGAYGGTGALADWSRAAALAQTHPFLLAGGLTPHNVGAAIAQVRPHGVDVSSGVETDGNKDPECIEAFIRAVQSMV
jgi:phosphoribosylanthranilate isomerase